MPEDRKKRVKTKAGVKKEGAGESCCGAMTPGGTCCRVEAMVSIDERGQMILPKELRDRANIRAGDKLALTSLEKDGKVGCILLTKADDLSGMMMTIVLGPVVRDMA